MIHADAYTIADALRCVPSDDRDQWVRMGMAVKNELGESGWTVWADWSETASNYNERDAKAVWRSIKAAGGIGIGTLFKLAKDHGWGGTEPIFTPEQIAAKRAARAREDREQAEAKERAYRAAEKRAAAIVAQCKTDTHPYLAAKGFAEERGLVHGAALLIPMRSLDNKRVLSVQQIWKEGDAFKKKFLPNGRARGAIFSLGNGASTWLVEGYATGLSVRAALASLYQRARVVVCFSAHNLSHVAGQLTGPRYVVADHDTSKAGEKAAQATGLPWWMPPDLDTDANDFHARYGVRNLAMKCNELRRWG